MSNGKKRVGKVLKSIRSASKGLKYSSKDILLGALTGTNIPLTRKIANYYKKKK